MSDGSFYKQSEVTKGTTTHIAMKIALSTFILEVYTWLGRGLY